MENKVNIDKCKDYKNNMMRIFVDTGVPVEYMLNDEIMDIVTDQLLGNIDKISVLNNILFNGELDGTINEIFLFSTIMFSQVLRDIDRYNIRNITDIAEYLRLRNITDESLKLNIIMMMMVEEDTELDMDIIISLIGLSLISYLENNMLILSNIIDSINVYTNTLDIDDLIYNI